MKIEPGLYQHFKGNFYRVLFTARLDDSISNRIVGLPKLGVVYIPLTGSGLVAIRTAEDFLEHIERDGYSGPRFVKVED